MKLAKSTDMDLASSLFLAMTEEKLKNAYFFSALGRGGMALSTVSARSAAPIRGFAYIGRPGLRRRLEIGLWSLAQQEIGATQDFYIVGFLSLYVFILFLYN